MKTPRILTSALATALATGLALAGSAAAQTADTEQALRH